MTNRDVAEILRHIAFLLDMEGVEFKPRAYEKAAYAVEALEEPIAELYARGGIKALEEIPGVGKSIAQKIEELLVTGRMAYYEELRRKYPIDLVSLMGIEGVGPKTIRALYEALGITNLDELEQAARQGRIRQLPRFGEKTEAAILRGIEFLRRRGGRFLLGEILPLMEDVCARLAALPEVERVEIAGSLRRRKETVGDADLLVISRRPERVMEAFVSLPEVEHVHEKGETRSRVKFRNGLDVDLRVVPRESFGAALQYFTGSKEHNIALRRIAERMGLKLNEYGLFRGERRIAGRTEEEIYEALGLRYIPPELREDRGEIEAAREGRLPRLIEYGDLRGDLQVQTNWTDGANSIEEMALEARRLGLEYIAITDHTRSLAMTRGSDEAKLLEQIAEIRRLNRKLRGIRVLTGAEVNIRKDGTLDIRDDVLAQLDVVGIAVHSHFNLSRQEMTERIVRAMRNPHADILFHPTGRILLKREPYDVDMDEIIRVARETGTILEIDAYPERLDLKDEHIRKAVEAGVKLVIDSDAHHVGHFRVLAYGIAQARRGWAQREDILNTLPCEEFLAHLKDGRQRRRRL
ncbi:MAG: DNA polymerase/3'-5' exonuclease PolX [Blastocatellia bacterium]|nr:DNA polymerase/3'-5' exonuclease PolX [Blastocatellia bacterium]MCS7158142.1 DNA polymerase/3'-5' exonuclease PolX [Blastocatellia bacterium]MDW8168518.1 DNA polymerase/3'-5' exonuclease PolX [Acidobacteriota bacterium]MDW8256932.1 DNA polymerase/3'-5' exonuclease PolX [Acidobacteriota bacterium]